MSGFQENTWLSQILCLEQALTTACIDTELSDIVDTHVDLVIKSFSATDKQLIRFVNETLKDPILYAVKNCILHGWKDGQCPASFKDELCVINGIIFKVSRIIVPVSIGN